MTVGDGSIPPSDVSATVKDQLTPLMKEDLLYAQKYWKQPNRTVQDFLGMFDALENNARHGEIAISVDLHTEEGKQLLSAYRRLGQAIGIDVGQFRRVGDKSVAPIKEGDSRLQQVQEGLSDRANTKIYWSKYASDKPTYFKSLSIGVRDGIDHNSIVAFIGGDTPGTLDEKSRAVLSAKRVLTRAFGYMAGKYDIYFRSGTAVAPAKGGPDKF
jgi:hypothetical protein